ncbi:sensor histidine kinase [Sphingobacterium psychroaquaticum]|uniref:Histidine kinase n=1 Tax=Sphingobacterium psychroaquaticum TaxID=561061 RepID=A0A1X7I4V8_9SPHI|nr:histidine kinase [Sphingobacterium psychroaquaticum]SMG09560.1 Histidine kinase [Sphingobacterium psychroaquaticum]
MMDVKVEHNKGIPFLTSDAYRIHRHLFLQGIILLITIGVFFDTPDTLNLSVNRFWGWLTYYLFMNMLVFVNVYVLFPYFLAKDKIVPYVLSVVLFTFFALLILMVLQDQFYDIAVTRQEPSALAIFLSLSSSFLAILLFMGGMSAVLLFKPIMYSRIKKQELQKVASESELKFLKSQINPHFLFNTINNANILVEDEPEMAQHILTKLDDLLRFQLTDGFKDKVRLTDDIRLLIDYLELEKVRRDQFEFTVEMDGALDHIVVAPLLFIPFVENAVKHNLDSNGASYVKLNFKVENETLVFTCENSKPQRPVPQKVGGIGLVNIVRRLNLLYANTYTLEKIETAQNYTVKLKLCSVS